MIHDNTPVPIPDLPPKHLASFWSKVDKNGPLQRIGSDNKVSACWLWTGAVNRDGYGMFSYNGRRYRAHRIALKLAGRELPIKRDIHPDHLCSSKNCINPDHIETVSELENIFRGSGITAKYARRERCNKGHILNRPRMGDNGRTWRMCSICKKDTYERRKKKIREFAEKYCREQLAVMDGTAEAGIQRIGTERFEETVAQIVKIIVRNGWQG